MNRKKWALLFLCGVLLFGYYKLFYKIYSESAVAKSADCVIALDVKRITNTLLWNFITTPGQWEAVNIFKSGKKEISWKDMVEIPDYILAFHVNKQPANNWFVVLKVKDEKDFTNGLLRYHFVKKNNNEYTSKDFGLSFFKQNGKLLLTNNIDATSNYLTQVADELFAKKLFITKTALKKAIDAKSHLAVFMAANNFLKQDGIVAGNFDKNKIEISTALLPISQYNFTENNFSFSSNSLCTMGFVQPTPALYNLLNDSSKNKISKALSINIDSFFLKSNKSYEMDIAAIKPRVDSAITYTYDDDFNKIEKVVVNNIQEPKYNFNITGDSIGNIYNYFLRSNKLEKTVSGQLFTAIPLVKSYCNIKTGNLLNISSENYLPQPEDKSISCIFFINLLLSKIPPELLKYLPDDVNKVIANIESIHLKVNKTNEQIIFNCIVKKKKNNLPILKL